MVSGISNKRHCQVAKWLMDFELFFCLSLRPSLRRGWIICVNPYHPAESSSYICLDNPLGIIISLHVLDNNFTVSIDKPIVWNVFSFCQPYQREKTFSTLFCAMAKCTFSHILQAQTHLLFVCENFHTKCSWYNS